MHDFSTSPPAAHIKQLRHHLGLNQPDFGEMLHCAARTVQEWEGARRTMHPAMWELALIKAERIKPLPQVWA
jgi:DNA-binding transcriptional regulator YiaG